MQPHKKNDEITRKAASEHHEHGPFTRMTTALGSFCCGCYPEPVLACVTCCYCRPDQREGEYFANSREAIAGCPCMPACVALYEAYGDKDKDRPCGLRTPVNCCFCILTTEARLPSLESIYYALSVLNTVPAVPLCCVISMGIARVPTLDLCGSSCDVHTKTPYDCCTWRFCTKLPESYKTGECWGYLGCCTPEELREGLTNEHLYPCAVLGFCENQSKFTFCSDYLCCKCVCCHEKKEDQEAIELANL